MTPQTVETTCPLTLERAEERLVNRDGEHISHYRVQFQISGNAGNAMAEEVEEVELSYFISGTAKQGLENVPDEFRPAVRELLIAWINDQRQKGVDVPEILWLDDIKLSEFLNDFPAPAR